MSTSLTGTFYLRQDIDVDATPTISTMDLSVYVDPVNKQALLIRACDFIWHDKTTYLPLDPGADWQAAIQLHDTTLGQLASFENPHQVASGSILSVSGSAIEANQDFFPDRLGWAKGEGRIIVNDTLEIATDGSASVPGDASCTVVLECKVVSLSQKDYIALALQTVADN